MLRRLKKEVMGREGRVGWEDVEMGEGGKKDGGRKAKMGGGGGVDNSIRLVWIPRVEACCHSKLFAIHQNPDTVLQDPAACERLNKYIQHKEEQNVSTKFVL
jgi:hypothetical protein